MVVRYYTSAGGARPVESYVLALPVSESRRVLGALLDVEAGGFEGSAVAARHIEGKLWELKIGRHRIFYVVISGPTLVLLHAYRKQGRRAPVRELDVARRRLAEVLAGA